MNRRYSRALTMITTSLTLTILAGCGGGGSSPTKPKPPTPPTPPPAPVATSITINPSSHTLASIGATVQLTATVRDQNNNPMSGQTVTWTSANTAVATVSATGLVTAVSNGSTQITARSGNASGSASITVAEPVPTRITVTPSSHTLEAIGATVQLTATVRDQRNNVMSGLSVTWSSGDESVATVSEEGLVTAVSNGMADITASHGSITGRATITVSEPVPTTIAVEPASHTLEAIGQSVQLMAMVLDQRENAMPDEPVTWSSGDEAVATVDAAGLVTAVSNGMAEIMAKAGEVSGSAAISVLQVPAGISIEVGMDATTLTEIGQTLQLMVSVIDANDEPVDEPEVTWSSSDETVVTVDADGLVTAVGNGVADVVAMAGGVSDMVRITVMDSAVPVATTVMIEPASHTLEAIGATVQLTATVLDQDGNEMTDVPVEWSSGDEDVATVDMDGLVTAVGNGMTEVVAMAGDVSDMVSITVSITVDEITYVPWVGVRVARGMLIFSSSIGAIDLTECFTENLLLGSLLPPEGIKNWDAPTGDNLTVHFSVWQTRADMDSPWNEIEDTRVMYNACPYDSDVAGEYRLVGDITLNGEREFRRSENTFTVP